MPYDNVDIFVEMQEIKLAIEELQRKVFPERFKEEQKGRKTI